MTAFSYFESDAFCSPYGVYMYRLGKPRQLKLDGKLSSWESDTSFMVFPTTFKVCVEISYFGESLWF